MLTDSRYLQLGASRRALHWRSTGWASSLGTLKANILVWKMLLHEMAKPGRVIRWEHGLHRSMYRGTKWPMG